MEKMEEMFSQKEAEEEAPIEMSAVMAWLDDLICREPELEVYRQELNKVLESKKKGEEKIVNTEKRLEEESVELAVVRAKRREEELVVEELESQLVQSKAKVLETKEKVESLKKSEIEKGHRIEVLQKKNNVLRLQLSQRSDWSDDQLVRKEEVKGKIYEINTTLEEKNSQLLETRNDIDKLQALVQGLESDIEKKRQKVFQVHNEIEEKRELINQEIIKKKEAENTLSIQQEAFEIKSKQVVQNEARAKAESSRAIHTENQLKEAKKEMATYLSNYEALYANTRKETEALETLVAQNEKQQRLNEDMEKSTKAKEQELTDLEREKKNIDQENHGWNTKLNDIEQERNNLETETSDMYTKLQQIEEVDLKASYKQAEQLKKQLDDLEREKEIVSRKIGTAEHGNNTIKEFIRVNETTKKNLQNEIESTIQRVKKQRVQIEDLLQQAESRDQEAAKATQKYQLTLEHGKLLDAQSAEVQRKLIEAQARLKQQQKLYESVRAERNQLSKELITNQNEIAEMKRKFKVANRTIEQLKEEITTKDHALVKEHFNHHNVDKERESLKNELTKIRKQISGAEQIIQNQKSEIQKLTHILRDAEEEGQRQQKEYDAIMGERNILNTQLVKRNEELSTVYEKIKLNNSRLRQGEARYTAICAEIQQAQVSLEQKQAQRTKHNDHLTSMQDLKYTITSLESALRRERVKIRALQDELARPLHVHRWRLLESSDPKRFELIKSIHRLQKELIQITDSVHAKEDNIKEKEQLYMKLKTQLARRPGPQVKDQLLMYQQKLKEKKAHLNLLQKDLDIQRSSVKAHQSKIEEYSAEFEAINDAWINQQLSIHKAKLRDQGLRKSFPFESVFPSSEDSMKASFSQGQLLPPPTPFLAPAAFPLAGVMH